MPLVPFIGFFIGFFGCGLGHRGPMNPYCPVAPRVVSPPLIESNENSKMLQLTPEQELRENYRSEYMFQSQLSKRGNPLIF
ncbi:unnamed protein product [Staurois parvus]|uniref:Uncharacterized protein n=1 Tax=Staurois parvus TaxID=386267 RepID=A0ABN9EWL7_9NEOB|nr:unnamed protein product [Staurois parvus]